MTPTNALVTASPADTVKIITDTISAPDDAPDRITVQLDPPELGRVSIDFKFDSHGLQHVTVTGENPEALRQLRMMHFELTQALERSGLSSQNMTFQQQQSGQQQAHASPARSLFATQDSDSSTSALITPAVQPARPPRMAGGGLNIRL
jgi:flagellar hook-length control protein FliK